MIFQPKVPDQEAERNYADWTVDYLCGKAKKHILSDMLSCLVDHQGHSRPMGVLPARPPKCNAFRRCFLGINRQKSTILAHYYVKKPCNPSRIPSAFFRVLHSKSRILWCIRSFLLKTIINRFLNAKTLSGFFVPDVSG